MEQHQRIRQCRSCDENCDLDGQRGMLSQRAGTTAHGAMKSPWAAESGYARGPENASLVASPPEPTLHYFSSSREIDGALGLAARRSKTAGVPG